MLKLPDPLVAFDRAIGEVIGRIVPTLFCVVDLDTSNGLKPAARELVMINRLLIVPGKEHAMQIIYVDLCLLVLRPRGSIVLQGSHIMNAPGIL